MVQPWLPPSQIIPVMLLAMLLMVWAICWVVPSRSRTNPQAMPVPAAMAQPQNAESLPEYSLLYMLYLLTLEASQTLGTLTAEEYAEVIGHLQTAADQMPENIDRVKTWAAANQTTLRNMQVAYLVGKKQAAVVAAEGALKLLETILIPAQAFDFEEFLHGSSCSIDSHIAGFYMLPDTKDRDYERMQHLVAYHREQSAPVYTIGTESGSDVRDLCLLRSGAWYTQPFELILPLQIISNDLPGVLGLDGVGHERFWVLDKKLGIKAKFEG